MFACVLEFPWGPLLSQQQELSWPLEATRATRSFRTILRAPSGKDRPAGASGLHDGGGQACGVLEACDTPVLSSASLLLGTPQRGLLPCTLRRPEPELEACDSESQALVLSQSY